jgi:hypothetical protein
MDRVVEYHSSLKEYLHESLKKGIIIIKGLIFKINFVPSLVV